MDVNEIIRILSDIRSKYNCFDAEDEECYRGLSEAIKMLTAQQWIPCNERLPEDGKTVLVQFDDGDMEILTFPNIYKRLNRVAWMPLPEPWKGEEHG